VRSSVIVSCETAAGAEPVAVVLFSGSDEALQAAVAQANRGLAEFQQIRRVLRWPELQFPYTSTGKLIRRQVAQWACDTLSGRRQAGGSLAGTGRDMLLDLIAEVTGEPVGSPHQPGGADRLRLSEDLHLDSLGRVQLQSALEQRFGLELEDDAVANLATLGELRTMVEQGVDADHPPHPAGDPLEDHGSPDQPATRQLAEIHADASDHLYPHWPWSWPVQALRVAFVELVMRPLVWLLAAPRVVLETTNLPNAPVLLIANHVTAYDGALILYALPAKLRRRVAAAMSGEMLLDLRHGRNQTNPFLNLLAPAAYWLLTALFNVFPLPRARGFRRSFAHAGEAMDHGYSVLIFPEGTRSRDGKLHRFRPGIGLLAKESRVPVVPVALIGLGELRAGKARWFRSGKLAVHVGAAVPVEEAVDPSQLSEMLEQKVRSLQSSPEDSD